jgi:hypothetical protein
VTILAQNVLQVSYVEDADGVVRRAASHGATGCRAGDARRLVVVWFGFFCGRFGGAAIQEVAFLLLLLTLVRPFGIVLFHFQFLGGGQRG